MVENSLLQYFDKSAEVQAYRYRKELVEEANAGLADTLGEDEIDRIRSDADDRLAELSGLVDEINQALHVDPDELGLETPEDPEVIVGDVDEQEEPLIDTGEGWGNATVALKRRKAYQAT